MHFNTHGGSCCGRHHIYDMDGATTDSIQRFMRTNGLLNDGTNKITEIVVSEENTNLERLRGAIEGAGFVLVAVWDNCSGSRCYMYLHANDWQAFPNGAAVNVAPPPPPPAPRPIPVPREEPRVVSSTYHNVLRAGRSEAGWLTREAAVNAAPRAIRIDRRDVYASGVVRWHEAV